MKSRRLKRSRPPAAPSSCRRPPSLSTSHSSASASASGPVQLAADDSPTPSVSLSSSHLPVSFISFFLPLFLRFRFSLFLSAGRALRFLPKRHADWAVSLRFLSPGLRLRLRLLTTTTTASSLASSPPPTAIGLCFVSCLLNHRRRSLPRRSFALQLSFVPAEFIQGRSAGRFSPGHLHDPPTGRPVSSALCDNIRRRPSRPHQHLPHC